MFGYSIKPKSQNPSTSFDPRWELLPWPPGEEERKDLPKREDSFTVKLPMRCKRKKFPIKDRKKKKEKKKRNPQSKIKRKKKRYTERSSDQTIFEKYKIVKNK